MTEFSKLEKEMLSHMVQLHKSHGLCIYSWISKIFDDNILFEDKPFTRQCDNGLVIKYEGCQESELLLKISYFHFLFERLESAHLIKTDHLNKVDFKFTAKNLENEYFLSGFPYRHLYNFFSWFGYNPILVSNYIVELVENEFQTSEQKRFELQLKKAKIQIRIAWAAFITSIVAVLASMILGIIQIFINLLISFTLKW